MDKKITIRQIHAELPIASVQFTRLMARLFHFYLQNQENQTGYTMRFPLQYKDKQKDRTVLKLSGLCGLIWSYQ